MKRKIVFILLAVLLSATLAVPTLAAEPIKVIVWGKNIASDVPAQNVNGRVLVPVRPIFEALGAKVYWDTSSSIAVGSKNKPREEVVVVKLTLNSNKYSKETFGPYVRKNLDLDVPAMIIDGRTMVPARVVAESMGVKVEWDGSTNTVIVGNRYGNPSAGVIGDGGEKTGQEIKYKNAVYQGSTLDGKRHGSGVYTNADGYTYTGQYYQDKEQGWGTYTYPNGDKYVGQWLNGSQHGLGTYYYASGSKYEGQFNYGKKHGKGTFTWYNGDKYVGTYTNDVRHGYGVMTWASGQVWKGQYVNGKAQR